LVLVSPSTVRLLKLAAVARFSARLSAGAAMAASVTTRPSRATATGRVWWIN
jgi:hypothetical protein